MIVPELVPALLQAMTWTVFAYFVVSNGVQTLLLGGAAVELWRHAQTSWGERPDRLLGSPATPSMSVLAPAFNEATTVGESVRALLTLSYPGLEIVLINDGSTDGTLRVLQETFDLVAIHPVFRRQVETQPVRALYRSRAHPGLVVIDKENGGKADSLNAGLNLATGELVCAVDADTLIEPDAFLRIVRPFLGRDDVVAAGAPIRVVNGSAVRDGRVVAVRSPRRPLAGIQAVEYLRAFLFGRLGWNVLGGNLIVSGAFGMFRRDAMLGAGGYLHDTVGEDMELIVRLRRRGVGVTAPSRVTFVPDPIAWTEVPETLAVLGRQRDRWQRGLADVLWRHRGLFGNPRAGALGLFVFPYFVVVELLGPLIEVIGLVGLAAAVALDAVNVPFAVLFLLVAYGWGLILSLAALLLHHATTDDGIPASDLARQVGWAFLENLGYRQLTVLWRVRGLVRYLQRRTDWGTMSRRGFTTVSAPR